MKRFAIAFCDFFDNSLTVTIIEAASWQDAIEKHPSYPYSEQKDAVGEILSEFTTIAKLHKRYPALTEEEAVKQCCFDCDCLMGWIEV